MNNEKPFSCRAWAVLQKDGRFSHFEERPSDPEIFAIYAKKHGWREIEGVFTEIVPIPIPPKSKAKKSKK